MRAREHPGRGARRPPALKLLAGQVGYQCRLLVRSPIGSFATLMIPLMVLLAMNLLFEDTHLQTRGGIAWAQFFTPAMVAFGVVGACYMSIVTSTTLARDEGILKRLRSTPLPPWVYMTGRIITAGVVALAGTIVLFAVGAGLYGFDIVWSAVPSALLTIVVAIVSFCSLGLAVTALVPNADSALPLAWGTILPLCFVSDIFQPIDTAPGWLRMIASWLPLRPFADDLERLFNPVRGTLGVNWVHLGVLGAWALGGALFALLAFRWEPRWRRRRAGGPRESATYSVSQLRELFESRGR